MDHNLKLVLGLIWSLVLRYRINSTSPSTYQVSEQAAPQQQKAASPEPKKHSGSPRKLLLLWMNAILADNRVTNFTSDWNDGVILSALINYCQPGLIPDISSLDTTRALENIKRAMQLANEHLGVPPVMVPSDLASEKPDELSVMTYISFYCSAESPGSKRLLLWVKQQIPTASIRNFTTDWYDGCALGKLVNAITNGGFPDGKAMTGTDPVGNAQRSMAAAQYQLSITTTLTPEEFVDQALNHLSRMTYIAQLQRAKEAKEKGKESSIQLQPVAVEKITVSPVHTPDQLGLNKLVWIDLDCADAGDAELTAEASGEVVGNVAIEVESRGPDLYRVKFLPPSIDLYTTSIRYGGEHVPGSPMAINLHPPQAEKVQHVETIIPEAAGGAVSLSFSTAHAGCGTITGKAKGISAGEVPIRLDKKADGTYLISFKPPYPDLYKVDVNWGSFSADAVGSSVGPVPIEIFRQPNDCHLCFKPPQPDLYKVNVSWGGEPVPGSPFTIDLQSPTEPDKVECGDPIFTGIGEVAELPIDITYAGPGEFLATCIGDKVGEVPTEVACIMKKFYHVSFMPTEEDRYTLNVCYGGKRIKGSPFIVDLRKPVDEEVVTVPFEIPILERSLDFGHLPKPAFNLEYDVPPAGAIPPKQQQRGTEVRNIIGQKTLVRVTPLGKEKKRAKLTATARGAVTGPTDVHIVKRLDGVFEASIDPQEPDCYTFRVFVNQHPLPQSPFVVTYIPSASNASQCPVDGTDIFSQPIDIDTPVTLSIDCTNGGEGPLEVTADGPFGQKEPSVTVQEKEDRPLTYDIKMVAFGPGLYTMNVLWGGTHVPNSPFRFLITDPKSTLLCPYGKPIGIDYTADCKPTELKVDAVHYESGNHIRVKTKQTARGKYKLSFSPKDPGTYLLHIYIKDKELPNSPLIVQYKQPPLAEVVSVSKLPESAHVGDMFSFEIDGKLAGSGELNIKTSAPKGNKAEKMEVTVSDNKDGTFLAECTPVAPGDHSFSISWSGKPIPHSPFHVAVTEKVIELEPAPDLYAEPDPFKCVIDNLKDIPLSFPVNKTTSFTISTQNAGPGELEASVEGPTSNPGRLEVTPVGGESHKYQVSYTPQQVGRHDLHLKWSGKELLSSPLRFDVGKLPSFEHGKPVHMDFSIDARQGDLESYAIHKDSDTRFKAKVTKVQKGKYRVNFNPSEPGMYDVHVLVKQKDIPGSPFQISYGAPAHPERVKISETVPKTWNINTPLFFPVDTHEAGPGHLTCQLTAPKAPTKPKLSVEDREHGVYHVHYTPNAPGNHLIHLLWADKDIPGSPVKITVREPDVQSEEVEEVILTAPSDEERHRRRSWSFNLPGWSWRLGSTKDKDKSKKEYNVPLGRPFRLSIKGAKGDDEIIAAATGEKAGTVDVQVYRTWDGVAAQFSPTQPDKYSLEVKMNKEHVPGSPFNVNYFIPSQKCRIIDPPPAHVEMDEKVEFKVDCHEAGDGSLEVSPKAPESGKHPDLLSEVMPLKPGRVLISYTPHSAGTHALKLSWNGHEIPESPVTFEVTEQTSMSITNALANFLLGGFEIHDEEDQEVEIQPPLESEVFPDGDIDTGIGIKEGDDAVYTATCFGEDYRDEVDVKMMKTSPTNYKVSFTPKQPDMYRLSIYRNDREVKGSPHMIDLRGKPIKPVIEEMEAVPVSLENAAFLDFEKFDSEEGEEILDLPLPDLPVPSSEPITGSPKHKHDIKDKEDFTCNIGTAIAVKVTAHSDAQRSGELVARATGDRTGPAEISVRHESEDLFTINFNPIEPDRYTIEATLNEEPLPKTPFVVRYVMPPTDATKCKLIGSGDLSEMLEVGEETSFMVDVRAAGEGQLDIRSEGPSADEHPSNLEVQSHPEKPATHCVSYTPTAPGMHLIHVNWAGTPIPASPIRLTVIDRAAVPEHPHGEPVGIDIASEGGADIRAYACHERDTDEIPVKILQGDGNKYRLSFTPVEPGLYYVHIFANDREIPSSPMVVKYSSAPKPEACRLVGITSSGYIGEPVSFDIDVSEAGGGKLKIRLEVPGTEQGKITVNDNKDGTLTVQYIPVAAGKHMFHVLWGGQDIPNSPFSVQVRDREDEKLMADVFLRDRTTTPHQVDLPDGSTGTRIEATTDMSVMLQIKTCTEEQRAAPITSTVVGEKTGIVYPQISKPSDESYTILFTPPQPDCYTIEAKLGSEIVPSTPLVVNYTEAPADETKAKLVTADTVPTLLQPDKEINFKVDMRLAGEGTLGVRPEPPEGGDESQFTTEEEEPYVYNIKYVPSTPGTHLLHVTWSDKPIPGSPMNFNVQPVLAFPHGKKAGLEMDLVAKEWEVESYAIHTDSGSRHPVKASRVKKEKFHLAFKPKDAGLYALHVLVQKKEIAGSPFLVRYDTPANPQAVIVSGLKKRVWIREPTYFNIDASEAGSGLLRISVKPPRESKKPHIAVKDIGNKNYTIEYIPEAAGVHYFTITWDGRPIPDSPLSTFAMRPSMVYSKPHEIECEAADVQPTPDLGSGPQEPIPEQQLTLKEYQVPLGRAVRVKVNPRASIQRSGMVVAIAHGASEGDIAIPVERDDDHNFVAVFNPTEPDRYLIQVKLNDKDVPGTPFIADYYLPPAEPTNCVISKVPASVKLNQKVRFQVDCTDCGNGDLDVDAEGPSVDEAEIFEGEPGKYSVSYTPTAPGSHLLHVKWAKQPVPLSPVKFEVSDARKVTIDSESTPAVLSVGQPIDLAFDTSKAGCGTLTSTCTGSSVGEMPVTVTKEDEHKYRVAFTPTEQDLYHLGVFWDDRHVWGSPFKIDLKERKVDVKKIATSKPQISEDEVSMTLETGDAGKGDISAVCIDSRAKQVHVETQETSPNKYKIVFKPPKPDIYTMAVKYGGQNVEGSPFRINTLPSDASRVGVSEPDECKVGEPSVYEFSTLYAGPGTLNASCHGDLTGEVPVDVVHEDGTPKYKVAFTPHEPDLYTLHVKWDDTDISKSPFIINLLPSHPEKIITKVVTEPSRPEEDVELDIDTREGGQGSLTAKCTGAVCGDVTARVLRTSATGYKVNFTPPVNDLYTLNVFYNDTELASSPHMFDLRMPSIEQSVEKPQWSEPLDDHFLNLIDQFSKEIPRTDEREPSPAVLEPVSQLESIPQADLKPQYGKEYYIPPDNGSSHEGSPGPELKLPSKPSVEEFTNLLGRALVVKVKAQTKEQKEGMVIASAVGESIGETPIEVRKKDTELFEVVFNPKEADRYTVDIRLNDEPIPRSPFVVRYIVPPVDASKCKILGLKDIPAHVSVGQEVEFGLSCKGAGGGTLDSHVEGPVADGESPVLEISPSTENEYSVKYTPTAAGHHFLHFQWSGSEVPGSPLKILVIDQESLVSFPAGKPAAIDIDYGGRQSDLRAYAIRDGTSTQINGRISKGTAKGKYKITLSLKDPGLYYIHIKARDNELPMSPLVVRILKPARPDLIKVVEFPRNGIVDNTSSFTIDCTDAGDGDLHLNALGPGGKEKGTLSQKDNKDGTYTIEYCPSVSGMHHFQMTWAGKSVPSGSLALPVLEEGADKQEITLFPHGKPIELEIVTEGKDVEAHAIHKESGGRYKVKVSKVAKGKYKLILIAKQSGLYDIHVLQKKKEIFGSPFQVRYDKPPTPEACIVRDIPSNAYVFEPFQFSVDVKDAGSGRIGVEVHGTAKGTVTVDGERDRVFEMTYIATCPGDDKIDITWDKEPIPGSPCKIHIVRRVPTCNTALTGTVNVVEVGEKVSFLVCNVGKGEGELGVSVIGLKTGKADAQVDKIDDSCYKVCFTPEIPDDYTLELKVNEKHIQCSPLLIKVIEKGALSPSYVRPPDGTCHSDVTIQQRVGLILGLDEVDSPDDITSTCEGPGGICETVTSEGVDGSYGLCFNPPVPGNYQMRVKVKGVEHPASPFNITCIDKEPDCTIDESSIDLFSIPTDLDVSPSFDIRVKEEAQGKGVLTANVKGPGEAEAVITHTEPGLYTCTISSSTPGRYLVYIHWNGVLLKGCPLGITFQQPLSIIGLDLEGKTMQVGLPHHFKVDCGDMGEGDLELHINPAGAADIQANRDVQNVGIYHCVIVPRQSGMGFEITARYNQYVIVGSPYKVNFSPSSRPRMVFSIESERSVTSNFSAQVESRETHKEMAATLTQLLQNQFSLEFEPTEGKEYEVTLKYLVRYVPEERAESEQVEMDGSPFKLAYAGGSSCALEGAGLGYAVAGKWSQFTVSTESAGPGALQVEFEAEEETLGEAAQVEIKTVGEGKYEVNYKVNRAGSYKMYVLWGGRPLPGSPFYTIVQESEQQIEWSKYGDHFAC